jgi:hypothetical protein
MNSAADDCWVNGGATTPTSAVDATMSLGKGLASKERGRATRKVGNYYAQPATYRRGADGREEKGRGTADQWERGSVVWSRIPDVGVWWRGWQLAWVGLDRGGGLSVARGIALRVTVALCNSVRRMCVQTGVAEGHLLEHECERIKRGG